MNRKLSLESSATLYNGGNPTSSTGDTRNLQQLEGDRILTTPTAAPPAVPHSPTRGTGGDSKPNKNHQKNNPLASDEHPSLVVILPNPALAGNGVSSNNNSNTNYSEAYSPPSGSASRTHLLPSSPRRKSGGGGGGEVPGEDDHLAHTSPAISWGVMPPHVIVNNHGQGTTSVPNTSAAPPHSVRHRSLANTMNGSLHHYHIGSAHASYAGNHTSHSNVGSPAARSLAGPSFNAGLAPPIFTTNGTNSTNYSSSQHPPPAQQVGAIQGGGHSPYYASIGRTPPLAAPMPNLDGGGVSLMPMGRLAALAPMPVSPGSKRTATVGGETSLVMAASNCSPNEVRDNISPVRASEQPSVKNSPTAKKDAKTFSVAAVIKDMHKSITNSSPYKVWSGYGYFSSPHYSYNSNSLFIFKGGNIIRRFCYAFIYRSTMIQVLLLSFIAANCVVVGIQEPLRQAQVQWYNQHSVWALERFFICVFLVELAFKIVALGAVIHPHSYLNYRSRGASLNWLDFVCVIVSAATHFSGSSMLSDFGRGGNSNNPDLHPIYINFTFCRVVHLFIGPSEYISTILAHNLKKSKALKDRSKVPSGSVAHLFAGLRSAWYRMLANAFLLLLLCTAFALAAVMSWRGRVERRCYITDLTDTDDDMATALLAANANYSSAVNGSTFGLSSIYLNNNETVTTQNRLAVAHRNRRGIPRASPYLSPTSAGTACGGTFTCSGRTLRKQVVVRSQGNGTTLSVVNDTKIALFAMLNATNVTNATREFQWQLAHNVPASDYVESLWMGGYVYQNFSHNRHYRNYSTINRTVLKQLHNESEGSLVDALTGFRYEEQCLPATYGRRTLIQASGMSSSTVRDTDGSLLMRHLPHSTAFVFDNNEHRWLDEEFFVDSREVEPTSFHSYLSLAVSPYHFFNLNTVPSALVFVWRVIALDDRGDDLFAVVTSNGYSTYIYFILLSILGTFYLMNLFLAILVNGYSVAARDSRGIELEGAHRKQRDYKSASQPLLLASKPSVSCQTFLSTFDSDEGLLTGMGGASTNAPVMVRDDSAALAALGSTSSQQPIDGFSLEGLRGAVRADTNAGRQLIAQPNVAGGPGIWFADSAVLIGGADDGGAILSQLSLPYTRSRVASKPAALAGRASYMLLSPTTSKSPAFASAPVRSAYPTQGPVTPMTTSLALTSPNYFPPGDRSYNGAASEAGSPNYTQLGAGMGGTKALSNTYSVNGNQHHPALSNGSFGGHVLTESGGVTSGSFGADLNAEGGMNRWQQQQHNRSGKGFGYGGPLQRSPSTASLSTKHTHQANGSGPLVPSFLTVNNLLVQHPFAQQRASSAAFPAGAPQQRVPTVTFGSSVDQPPPSLAGINTNAKETTISKEKDANVTSPPSLTSNSGHQHSSASNALQGFTAFPPTANNSGGDTTTASATVTASNSVGPGALLPSPALLEVATDENRLSIQTAAESSMSATGDGGHPEGASTSETVIDKAGESTVTMSAVSPKFLASPRLPIPTDIDTVAADEEMEEEDFTAGLFVEGGMSLSAAVASAEIEAGLDQEGRQSRRKEMRRLHEQKVLQKAKGIWIINLLKRCMAGLGSILVTACSHPSSPLAHVLYVLVTAERTMDVWEPEAVASTSDTPASPVGGAQEDLLTIYSPILRGGVSDESKPLVSDDPSISPTPNCLSTASSGFSRLRRILRVAVESPVVLGPMFLVTFTFVVATSVDWYGAPPPSLSSLNRSSMLEVPYEKAGPAFFYARLCCTTLITIHLILKLVAFGPRRVFVGGAKALAPSTFSSPPAKHQVVHVFADHPVWNVLDLVVIAAYGWPDIIIGGFSEYIRYLGGVADFTSPYSGHIQYAADSLMNSHHLGPDSYTVVLIVVSLLRNMRTIRMIRVLRAYSTYRTIKQALRASWSSLITLLALILALSCTYAVLGQQLFGLSHEDRIRNVARLALYNEQSRLATASLTEDEEAYRSAVFVSSRAYRDLVQLQMAPPVQTLADYEILVNTADTVLRGLQPVSAVSAEEVVDVGGISSGRVGAVGIKSLMITEDDLGVPIDYPESYQFVEYLPPSAAASSRGNASAPHGLVFRAERPEANYGSFAEALLSTCAVMLGSWSPRLRYAMAIGVDNGYYSTSSDATADRAPAPVLVHQLLAILYFISLRAIAVLLLFNSAIAVMFGAISDQFKMNGGTTRHIENSYGDGSDGNEELEAQQLQVFHDVDRPMPRLLLPALGRARKTVAQAVTQQRVGGGGGGVSVQTSEATQFDQQAFSSRTMHHGSADPVITLHHSASAAMLGNAGMPPPQLRELNNGGNSVNPSAGLLTLPPTSSFHQNHSVSLGASAIDGGLGATFNGTSSRGMDSMSPYSPYSPPGAKRGSTVSINGSPLSTVPPPASSTALVVQNNANANSNATNFALLGMRQLPTYTVSEIVEDLPPEVLELLELLDKKKLAKDAKRNKKFGKKSGTEEDGSPATTLGDSMAQSQSQAGSLNASYMRHHSSGGKQIGSSAALSSFTSRGSGSSGSNSHSDDDIDTDTTLGGSVSSPTVGKGMSISQGMDGAPARKGAEGEAEKQSGRRYPPLIVWSPDSGLTFRDSSAIYYDYEVMRRHTYSSMSSRWRAVKGYLLHTRPVYVKEESLYIFHPENKFRKGLIALVGSRLFETFIILAILASVVLLFFETAAPRAAPGRTFTDVSTGDASTTFSNAASSRFFPSTRQHTYVHEDSLTGALNIVDVALTSVFILEMLMKIVAFGLFFPTTDRLRRGLEWGGGVGGILGGGWRLQSLWNRRAPSQGKAPAQVQRRTVTFNTGTTDASTSVSVPNPDSNEDSTLVNEVDVEAAVHRKTQPTRTLARRKLLMQRFAATAAARQQAAQSRSQSFAARGGAKSTEVEELMMASTEERKKVKFMPSAGDLQAIHKRSTSSVTLLSQGTASGSVKDEGEERSDEDRPSTMIPLSEPSSTQQAHSYGAGDTATRLRMRRASISAHAYGGSSAQLLASATSVTASDALTGGGEGGDGPAVCLSPDGNASLATTVNPSATTRMRRRSTYSMNALAIFNADRSHNTQASLATTATSVATVVSGTTQAALDGSTNVLLGISSTTAAGNPSATTTLSNTAAAATVSSASQPTVQGPYSEYPPNSTTDWSPAASTLLDFHASDMTGAKAPLNPATKDDDGGLDKPHADATVRSSSPPTFTFAPYVDSKVGTRPPSVTDSGGVTSVPTSDPMASAKPSTLKKKTSSIPATALMFGGIGTANEVGGHEGQQLATSLGVPGSGSAANEGNAMDAVKDLWKGLRNMKKSEIMAAEEDQAMDYYGRMHRAAEESPLAPGGGKRGKDRKSRMWGWRRKGGASNGGSFKRSSSMGGGAYRHGSSSMNRSRGGRRGGNSSHASALLARRFQPAYLSSFWNVLDLCINVLCTVGMIYIITDPGLVADHPIIQISRALRILRLLTHFATSQVVLAAMLASVPHLLQSFLITAVLFFMSASVGVQLFKGHLHQCADSRAIDKVSCLMGIRYYGGEADYGYGWDVDGDNYKAYQEWVAVNEAAAEATRTTTSFPSSTATPGPFGNVTASTSTVTSTNTPTHTTTTLDPALVALLSLPAPLSPPEHPVSYWRAKEQEVLRSVRAPYIINKSSTMVPHDPSLAHTVSFDSNYSGLLIGPTAPIALNGLLRSQWDRKRLHFDYLGGAILTVLAITVGEKPAEVLVDLMRTTHDPLHGVLGGEGRVGYDGSQRQGGAMGMFPSSTIVSSTTPSNSSASSNYTFNYTSFAHLNDTDPATAPRPGRPYMGLYVVVVFIVCNLFGLGLIVATIIAYYTSVRRHLDGTVFMTPQQRLFARTRHVIDGIIWYSGSGLQPLGAVRRLAARGGEGPNATTAAPRVDNPPKCDFFPLLSIRAHHVLTAPTLKGLLWAFKDLISLVVCCGSGPCGLDDFKDGDGLYDPHQDSINSAGSFFARSTKRRRASSLQTNDSFAVSASPFGCCGFCGDSREVADEGAIRRGTAPLKGSVVNSPYQEELQMIKSSAAVNQNPLKARPVRGQEQHQATSSSHETGPTTGPSPLLLSPADIFKKPVARVETSSTMDRPSPPMAGFGDIFPATNRPSEDHPLVVPSHQAEEQDHHHRMSGRNNNINDFDKDTDDDDGEEEEMSVFHTGSLPAVKLGSSSGGGTQRPPYNNTGRRRSETGELALQMATLIIKPTSPSKPRRGSLEEAAAATTTSEGNANLLKAKPMNSFDREDTEGDLHFRNPRSPQHEQVSNPLLFPSRSKNNSFAGGNNLISESYSFGYGVGGAASESIGSGNLTHSPANGAVPLAQAYGYVGSGPYTTHSSSGPSSLNAAKAAMGNAQSAELSPPQQRQQHLAQPQPPSAASIVFGNSTNNGVQQLDVHRLSALASPTPPTAFHYYNNPQAPQPGGGSRSVRNQQQQMLGSVTNQSIHSYFNSNRLSSSVSPGTNTNDSPPKRGASGAKSTTHSPHQYSKSSVREGAQPSATAIVDIQGDSDSDSSNGGNTQRRRRRSSADSSDEDASSRGFSDREADDQLPRASTKSILVTLTTERRAAQRDLKALRKATKDLRHNVIGENDDHDNGHQQQASYRRQWSNTSKSGYDSIDPYLHSTSSSNSKRQASSLHSFTAFERLVYGVIFLNVISMCFLHSYMSRREWLVLVTMPNAVGFSFLVLEMLLKWVSYGPIACYGGGAEYAEVGEVYERVTSLASPLAPIVSAPFGDKANASANSNPIAGSSGRTGSGHTVPLPLSTSRHSQSLPTTTPSPMRPGSPIGHPAKLTIDGRGVAFAATAGLLPLRRASHHYSTLAGKAFASTAQFIYDGFFQSTSLACHWNRIDLLVIICCVCQYIVEGSLGVIKASDILGWDADDGGVFSSDGFDGSGGGSGGDWSTPTPGRAIMLLSLARMVRLLRLPALRPLWASVRRSFGAFCHVLVFLVMSFFTFAVAGTILFGNVKRNGPLTDSNNFDSVLHSMLLLYQLSTSQGWVAMMEACAIEAPFCNNNAFLLDEVTVINTTSQWLWQEVLVNVSYTNTTNVTNIVNCTLPPANTTSSNDTNTTAGPNITSSPADNSTNSTNTSNATEICWWNYTMANTTHNFTHVDMGYYVLNTSVIRSIVSLVGDSGVSVNESDPLLEVQSARHRYTVDDCGNKNNSDIFFITFIVIHSFLLLQLLAAAVVEVLVDDVVGPSDPSTGPYFRLRKRWMIFFAAASDRGATAITIPTMPAAIASHAWVAGTSSPLIVHASAFIQALPRLSSTLTGLSMPSPPSSALPTTRRSSQSPKATAPPNRYISPSPMSLYHNARKDFIQFLTTLQVPLDSHQCVRFGDVVRGFAWRRHGIEARMLLRSAGGGGGGLDEDAILSGATAMSDFTTPSAATLLSRFVASPIVALVALRSWSVAHYFCSIVIQRAWRSHYLRLKVDSDAKRAANPLTSVTTTTLAGAKRNPKRAGNAYMIAGGLQLAEHDLYEESAAPPEADVDAPPETVETLHNLAGGTRMGGPAYAPEVAAVVVDHYPLPSHNSERRRSSSSKPLHLSSNENSDVSPSPNAKTNTLRGGWPHATSTVASSTTAALDYSTLSSSNAGGIGGGTRSGRNTAGRSRPRTVGFARSEEEEEPTTAGGATTTTGNASLSGTLNGTNNTNTTQNPRGAALRRVSGGGQQGQPQQLTHNNSGIRRRESTNDHSSPSEQPPTGTTRIPGSYLLAIRADGIGLASNSSNGPLPPTF